MRRLHSLLPSVGGILWELRKRSAGSWRSVIGPLSWVQSFVPWGQCVAFTGDSSLYGKGEMEFDLMWAGGCLGPGGRVCFSEDQGVNSASTGSS